MTDSATKAKIITLENIHSTPSNDHPIIAIKKLEIMASENWAILGGNGSGKSTLARMLSGQIPLRPGQRKTNFNQILSVSFEDEQQLLEREIYEDDSEQLDRIDPGHTVRELISEKLPSARNLEEIIELLQLGHFIDTGFRLLSTGERRRLMLARALAEQADMLILDEPYDGLDAEFSQHLQTTLEILGQKKPIVTVVNRLSQLSEKVTHIAFLAEQQLLFCGPREELMENEIWNQLQARGDVPRPLPAALPNTTRYSPAENEPVITLKNIVVGYHGKTIIEGLNWQIMPAEHWKISGPNGCGKSTLVNLISGDHPQCYSNDIHLFGKRRGVGESIWEIKQHMGLMSTSLHQQYRIHVTAETVVLSGFFDSIGVYRPVTQNHKNIATEWLDFLQLSHHKNTDFQKLSFGQQRMLLIARALIKQPHLLILDEPCQGLDPLNRALVIQLIEEIAQRQIAQILYISHEAEDKINCLTHELRFHKKNKPNPDSSIYQISTSELC